jgi:site-specific DNA recombinase
MAYTRISTRTSKRRLHYYRCLGSDGYRRLKGPVCTNRPIRQDALDELVWKEIIRLLDDPMLVQGEIDRRQQAARNADPLRKREETLRREQARLEKCSDRLISAYQEGLVTLPELRHRMPEVRKQAQAVESELQSLEMATVDQAKYLQLADSLATFRTRLRSRAETLDIRERQQILRLLVKEILVDAETITIRHSFTIPSGPESNGMPNPSSGSSGGPIPSGYLLRSGSNNSALRSALAVLPCRAPSTFVIPLMTGVVSHILIRCSVLLSTIRRATLLTSSVCGIVSKYLNLHPQPR